MFKPALTGLFLAVMTILMVPYGLGEEPPLSLVLSSEDITAIAAEDDTVWIKLTPEAAAELEVKTAHNIGRRLRVRLGDIVATEMVVHATVDTGIVQIRHPSAELTRALKAVGSNAAPGH